MACSKKLKETKGKAAEMGKRAVEAGVLKWSIYAQYLVLTFESNVHGTGITVVMSVVQHLAGLSDGWVDWKVSGVYITQLEGYVIHLSVCRI